jgi:putative endonuclease
MKPVRRQRGDEAEDAVVAFLAAHGYQVLERNFTCRYGEVDIVAEHGDTLCFIEVRMRSSSTWGDPSATVSFAKQRRVVKAALYYLQRHRRADQMLRFDVVSVLGAAGQAKLEHIPNAFDAGM